MSILIVYATVEGQTGKIAKFIADTLDKGGDDVVLADAGEPMADVSYDGADKVILAAPVHERRHPKPFEVLLRADREQLGRRKTLLISVSLKAAFEETREEAQEFLDEMKMRTDFQPDAELLVAGAVQPHFYDYYAEQILRHVILGGQDVDPEQQHEFTDWDALEKAVTAFAD